ncbi:hypothetical protein Tco_0089327 [Tanacetum coccineum]
MLPRSKRRGGIEGLETLLRGECLGRRIADCVRMSRRLWSSSTAELGEPGSAWLAWDARYTPTDTYAPVAYGSTCTTGASGWSDYVLTHTQHHTTRMQGRVWDDYVESGTIAKWIAVSSSLNTYFSHLDRDCHDWVEQFLHSLTQISVRSLWQLHHECGYCLWEGYEEEVK